MKIRKIYSNTLIIDCRNKNGSDIKKSFIAAGESCHTGRHVIYVGIISH
jgi:hypothetical protein